MPQSSLLTSTERFPLWYIRKLSASARYSWGDHTFADNMIFHPFSIESSIINIAVTSKLPAGWGPSGPVLKLGTWNMAHFIHNLELFKVLY